MTQTAEAGTTPGFLVEAVSLTPGPVYQWCFGGTNALPGATNAWATLDTVLLTNPTQLYFDVTMFRQPTRRYRLVAAP
jgi:hypothetical protein